VSEGGRRPYREFGAWMRSRRLARRWTQEELATLLGYDVTYVRKIEWGARKATEGVRARLAMVFELPVESLPDAASSPAAAVRLPSPATSFLGRTREVGEICDLLLRASSRLVTLVGAPGIGKTRLAIEAAAGLDDRLEHGSRFVPLLDVENPGDVPLAVCTAMGLAPSGPRAAERLMADHLRPLELLLVLDNFEHVAAAAPLAAFLLAEAPALRVLVTSREPLRVAGETQYPVPPLAFGGPGDPAVALFADRARMVRPDFTLETEDVEPVTGICSRLDGVPLAIELAAAATRLLSPAALLGELDHVLDLPSKGPRDAPAHQQTLRATIDWSYRLLEDEERAVFAHLGVFVGGFTLEAAAAVCGGVAVDRSRVVAGVASLVDKSLLGTRPDAPGASRVVALQAVHEFALERLEERGEADELRRRHARYYAELAERAEDHLTGKEQAAWLDVLGVEQTNLVAALRWALAADPPIALRLAAALWRFWLLRSHFTAGREWLEQALSLGPAEDPARVRAATGAGVLARSQGDYDRAEQLFDEATDLARRLGRTAEVALAVLNSGIVAEHRGRYDAAASLFEQSLSMYQGVGSHRGVGHALNCLGNIALDRGDTASATRFFEEALAAFKRLEDHWSVALACTNLGWVAYSAGDSVRARTWYDHSLAVHRSLGNERGIANTLSNIGRVSRLEGDGRTATAYLEEALLRFRRLGERRGVAECLGELAALAADDDRPARSARLYSAATALRDAIGAPPSPAELDAQERALGSLRGALGEPAFAEAWIHGQGMTPEDAILLALTRPAG
jgi:predicted ATPase